MLLESHVCVICLQLMTESVGLYLLAIDEGGISLGDIPFSCYHEVSCVNLIQILDSIMCLVMCCSIHLVLEMNVVSMDQLKRPDEMLT